MGDSSQAGQIGFGIQGNKGTAVAATRFARIRGGSMGGDRSLLIPDPEIGGNRDIADAYMGPIAFSGDIDFYPRMQMLAMLLNGAFGSTSSSDDSGATAEVQTLTVTGAPTGGTFRLSYKGVETSDLAYNIDSATLDTALEALVTIGTGNVAVAGDDPHVATFGGDLAAEDIDLLVLADNSLTGGTTPSVSIVETTPGVADVGTHIITPAATLPWLTVEERLGASLESFRYTDCRINSLRLEGDANGYLMGSANIIGLTGESGFSEQSTPPFDESPLIVMSNVVFSFGGTDLEAKSFSLDFTNNIENDDFRIGSVSLSDAVPKRRELTIGGAYRPDDATLWKQAMWGSSAVEVPQAGAAYKGPVTITISTYETIGGTDGGTVFSCTFNVPYAAIAPFKINPQGDDVIQTDIELTALRPGAAPLVTATVVNDLTSVS